MQHFNDFANTNIRIVVVSAANGNIRQSESHVDTCGAKNLTCERNL